MKANPAFDSSIDIKLFDSGQNVIQCFSLYLLESYKCVEEKIKEVDIFRSNVKSVDVVHVADELE